MSLKSRFPSSVEKSPADEEISEEQRQWMHFRLHFLVTSQASHFGVHVSVKQNSP
jgi:hypothetical protein